MCVSLLFFLLSLSSPLLSASLTSFRLFLSRAQTPALFVELSLSLVVFSLTLSLLTRLFLSRSLAVSLWISALSLSLSLLTRLFLSRSLAVSLWISALYLSLSSHPSLSLAVARGLFVDLRSLSLSLSSTLLALIFISLSFVGFSALGCTPVHHTLTS